MGPKPLDAIYFNFDEHGFLDPSIEKELIKFPAQEDLNDEERIS